jgi:hypothetical protein
VRLLVIAFLLMGHLSFSKRKSKEEPKETEDTKTLGYGVTTNTNSGLLGGFVVRSSSPVTVNKKNKAVHRYLAIEAVNIKHPKEKVVVGVYGTRFSYGKTNYFFSLRPEYGREWYFFPKSSENSIGLSGILAFGPSIGLEKPYYIKYARQGTDTPVAVAYNPDIHTDINSIAGSAGILQGLFTGIKINPGAHIKAAANLDMSTFGDNITGFELGTTMEFFARKPEIISSKFTSNPRVFVSAYLTLYFGNKKLLKKK